MSDSFSVILEPFLVNMNHYSTPQRGVRKKPTLLVLKKSRPFKSASGQLPPGLFLYLSKLETFVKQSYLVLTLQIPLIPKDARFLSQIDNFGSPPDDRYHLVFFIRRIKYSVSNKKAGPIAHPAFLLCLVDQSICLSLGSTRSPAPR